MGKRESPRFHDDAVNGYAHHFCGRLRNDGVAARADIGHVGFNQDVTVLAKRDFCGGLHD